MPARNPIPNDAEQATARMLRRVRLLIYLSGATQREIERRLGFSRGYLSQLLGGTVEIKLWHLLAVLHAIRLEPSEFFAELYPRHRTRALERLLDMRHKLRHKPLALELSQLYALGIESIADFCERLEWCENALDELADLGILPKFDLEK